MARSPKNILALTAMCWSCLIFFQPACGQVRIMAPPSLVEELAGDAGRIEGSTATFGAPFYGERILGRLVYGESKGKQHCTEDDYSVPDPEEYTPSGKSYQEVRLIHIVLVERGKCSFVTKVKVARAKKAHAVIIVDQVYSKATPKQIRDTIVADDGYGANIHIPSILISRQEGQKLIDAAKRSEVVVELAWDVPSDDVVVMDLWMSSASQESSRFIKDFSQKRAALNQYIKFVPHYHVFSMSSTTDFNDLCSDISAHYCAEDPDSAGAVTGRMVLTEDVRQLCIHELTKIPTDVRTKVASLNPQAPLAAFSSEWWRYTSRFLEECPVDGKDEQHSFGPPCAERLMHQIGIDVENVRQCIVSTKEQKLEHEQANTAWSPRALRINGWRYSGALDADLVTRAVCAGFIEKPPPCEHLVEPVNPFKFDPNEIKTSDGVTFFQMLEAVGAVAAFSICAMYLYKRSLTANVHSALREEVMLEVQSQMATYKQLES